MLTIVLLTVLFYFLQIILPLPIRSLMDASAGARADSAVDNLRETLPVFLALALLSIYFEIEENTLIALIWLVLRIVYVAVYVSGITARPAEESGFIPQPIRSLIWLGTIVCLFIMGINLARG